MRGVDSHRCGYEPGHVHRGRRSVVRSLQHRHVADAPGPRGDLKRTAWWRAGRQVARSIGTTTGYRASLASSGSARDYSPRTCTPCGAKRLGRPAHEQIRRSVGAGPHLTLAPYETPSQAVDRRAHWRRAAHPLAPPREATRSRPFDCTKYRNTSEVVRPNLSQDLVVGSNRGPASG